MRAHMAIEIGTCWRAGSGPGRRRWVFPAPAPRALVESLSGGVEV